MFLGSTAKAHWNSPNNFPNIEEGLSRKKWMMFSKL